MYRCKICNKEFDTKQKLGGHVSSHNRGEGYRKSRQVTGANEKRRNRIKLGDDRDCKFCGKIFTPKSIGGHVSRCKLNPNYDTTIANNSQSRRGSHLTPEHKKSLSESMKRAHKEGRAWNIGKSRWNNKKSYPEKFFENVINNEFENKKYTCEHPISIYSLDFAWIDLKKAIEIDGSQHERFKEYSERDKRKDKLANEAGWEILRIKWKDMYNNPKKWIQIAFDFIH